MNDSEIFKAAQIAIMSIEKKTTDIIKGDEIISITKNKKTNQFEIVSNSDLVETESISFKKCGQLRVRETLEMLMTKGFSVKEIHCVYK